RYADDRLRAPGSGRLSSDVSGRGPKETMQGHVDSVARNRLKGWVWDPAEPDAPVLLGIYDNGKPIGEIIADLFRDGLKDGGIGDGHHAFDWKIPGGLSPARSHTIEIRALSNGWLLPGSEAVLEAAVIGAGGADGPGLRGHVDSVTHDRI